MLFCFCFKQKTAYEMRICDWSSDVCSSDLARFEQLLKTLSQVYDLVIIDTPPVLPVTDAGIVGRLAGSVFMILKEGEHPMRIIEESVRRLRQSGVQLRGTIFTQVGASGAGERERDVEVKSGAVGVDFG